MRTIDQLLDAVRQEALKADFPIDRAVYDRAGKDPMTPILFAGSLDAPVCVFGRDLGKDEVAVGQPLVGAGGRLVRAGLHEWDRGSQPPKSDRTIDSALGLALLTNTVPYKPPGNKAYAEKVKERFRPYVAELLVEHWKGDVVLTLGTEAFRWFERYAQAGAADALWDRDDRYESPVLECSIEFVAEGKARSKDVQVAPLPHPSPLNQRWYGMFPELILKRLRAVRS